MTFGRTTLGTLRASLLLLLSLAFTPMTAQGTKAASKGAPGEVNWVALNPAFAKATYVKDQAASASCHEDATKAYAGTAHGRLFKHNPKGDLQARDCESCHGPRSLHVENQDASLKFSVKQYNQVCMQCHQDGGRMHWKGSRHQSSEVGCVSCHSVMKKESDRGLLARSTETATCYTCHAEVRGEMQKASHHPVREGKLSCSSCHNVHGSVGKSLLVGATVNETCFKCHQEKRGPFLYEHGPVRENCATCHNAHGTNNANLLETKGSFLCLQCHSYGGHINLPRYNRTSNPYGQGCVNCHTTQHGSNSPSGAKFTR